MSSKHPPLTCREVKRGLKKLGFEPRKQKGTSHEQWVKVQNGKIFKVTVDCPKEPFTGDLIKSMASQAGISKDDFYKACSK
jgi:predicted RNA binding protein YcfA (HicA-like mRNA interferase family)